MNFDKAQKIVVQLIAINCKKCNKFKKRLKIIREDELLQIFQISVKFLEKVSE